MALNFNRKSKRFHGKKGRFVKKKRGMGSIYARSEYHEYIKKYKPSLSPERGYEKMETLNHEKMATRDVVVKIFGVGNLVVSYIPAFNKVVGIWGHRAETLQLKVHGVKKNKDFFSTSISRFIDEIKDDLKLLNKALKKENKKEILNSEVFNLFGNLFNKMGDSGVVVKSVEVIFKKYL